MGFPVNTPNPLLQQGQPQQPPTGGTTGGPLGYTAQGPQGPIQATANTIGAASPQGANATRSGSWAAPGGMAPSKPLIQGMDSTLGQGQQAPTYSYMFANGGMPGYADGGMPMMPAPTPQMQGPQEPQQPQMGMGGPQGQQGQQPMGQPGQNPMPSDPRMMSMQLESVIRQNPEVAGQLQQAAQQIGITPQNAEQVSKIVMLAMQRPELYPQIRMYCIQAFGLDEGDLPPQFDPQFMSTLAVLAHAGSGGAGLSAPPPPDASGQSSMVPAQGQPQGMQQQPTQGGQPQQPSQAPTFQMGGKIAGPGTGTSDSITARVSDGEYIIPADVVRAKGTDFFDKLLESHHTKVGVR